jgi:nitrogenase iron protein NifH
LEKRGTVNAGTPVAQETGTCKWPVKGLWRFKLKFTYLNISKLNNLYRQCIKKMKQIALYGKGGIGKSTTSANLSAALAETGLDILQIGCDPKRDSTRMLMQGKFIPTVMDLVRERGEAEITLGDIMFTGYHGVRCVEAGGPEPGVGCAGRGIIATFQILERLGALKGDLIVYDVLGDVVCGGFAMPMREGYAQEVYLVTSGELMSLYAANNICKAIRRLSMRSRNRCRLAGVICNAKNLENEEELVRESGSSRNGLIADSCSLSRGTGPCNSQNCIKKP